MPLTIELLEPRQLLAGAPDIGASASRLIFNRQANAESRAQVLRVTNKGTKNLSISSVKLAGAAAAEFILDTADLRTTLKPGAATDVTLRFKPTSAGVFGATVQIASNDLDTPTLSVKLRGLGTVGRFNSYEPSLQRILDTYEIPVSVGDSSPHTATLDGHASTEEVLMALMKKAGSGPVRITPLAVFSWNFSPIAQIGWYTTNGTAAPTQRPVFELLGPDPQTLLPKHSGAATFDPGNGTFGLYSTWTSESHGPSFSESSRNLWDSLGSRRRKVRFYPNKTPTGRVIANSYVVAMEQGLNDDYQDAVMIIDNVTQAAAPAAPIRLKTAPTSASTIDLVWRDRSDNETEFLIERATRDAGPFAVVGKKGVGRAKFTDTGLSSGTRYYYRVCAANGAGRSAPTNVVASTAGRVVSEAESSQFGGSAVVASHQPGYVGGGFVTFTNSASGFVDFTVTAPLAGTYTFDLRYADGSGAASTLSLSTNGTLVDSAVELPHSGGWSKWRYITTTVSLQAGENHVRFSLTGNGAPLVDSLTLRL